MRICDFFSGECVAELRGHAEAVTAVRWAPDGRSLITASGDGGIFIWKLPKVMSRTITERLAEIEAASQASPGAATKADAPVLPSPITKVAKSPRRARPTWGAPGAGSSAALMDAQRASLHSILDQSLNNQGNGSAADDDSTDSPFKFNTKDLPAWARAALDDTTTTAVGAADGSPTNAAGGAGVTGRWAERVDSEIYLFSEVDDGPAVVRLDDPDEMFRRYTIEASSSLWPPPASVLHSTPVGNRGSFGGAGGDDGTPVGLAMGSDENVAPTPDSFFASRKSFNLSRGLEDDDLVVTSLDFEEAAAKARAIQSAVEESPAPLRSAWAQQPADGDDGIGALAFGNLDDNDDSDGDDDDDDDDDDDAGGENDETGALAGSEEATMFVAPEEQDLTPRSEFLVTSSVVGPLPSGDETVPLDDPSGTGGTNVGNEAVTGGGAEAGVVIDSIGGNGGENGSDDDDDRFEAMFGAREVPDFLEANYENLNAKWATGSAAPSTSGDRDALRMSMSARFLRESHSNPIQGARQELRASITPLDISRATETHPAPSTAASPSLEGQSATYPRAHSARSVTERRPLLGSSVGANKTGRHGTDDGTRSAASLPSSPSAGGDGRSLRNSIVELESAKLKKHREEVQKEVEKMRARLAKLGMLVGGGKADGEEADQAAAAAASDETAKPTEVTLATSPTNRRPGSAASVPEIEGLSDFGSASPGASSGEASEVASDPGLEARAGNEEAGGDKDGGDDDGSEPVEISSELSSFSLSQSSASASEVEAESSPPVQAVVNMVLDPAVLGTTPAPAPTPLAAHASSPPGVRAGVGSNEHRIPRAVSPLPPSPVAPPNLDDDEDDAPGLRLPSQPQPAARSGQGDACRRSLARLEAAFADTVSLFGTLDASEANNNDGGPRASMLAAFGTMQATLAGLLVGEAEGDPEEGDATMVRASGETFSGATERSEGFIFAEGASGRASIDVAASTTSTVLSEAVLQSTLELYSDRLVDMVRARLERDAQFS